MRTVGIWQNHHEPTGTLGLPAAALMNRVGLGVPRVCPGITGCGVYRGPLPCFIVWRWRPFEQSLPQFHWKEGRGADEYFNS